MDKHRLAAFQQQLLALRSEWEVSIAASKQETRPVEPGPAIGRLTRQDAMQSQQMALELQRKARVRLQGVETALRRVEDGTYGVCLRCEEEISEAPLRVRPEAPLCIRCAGQAA